MSKLGLHSFVTSVKIKKEGSLILMSNIVCRYNNSHFLSFRVNIAAWHCTDFLLAQPKVQIKKVTYKTRTFWHLRENCSWQTASNQDFKSSLSMRLKDLAGKSTFTIHKGSHETVFDQTWNPVDKILLFLEWREESNTKLWQIFWTGKSFTKIIIFIISGLKVKLKFVTELPPTTFRELIFRWKYI